MPRCEDWLWRAYRNGVSPGLPEPVNFYRNGKPGLISPGRSRSVRWIDMGRRRVTRMSCASTRTTFIGDDRAKAFELYRRSAKLGEPCAFFWAGYSYELGRGAQG